MTVQGNDGTTEFRLKQLEDSARDFYEFRAEILKKGCPYGGNEVSHVKEKMETLGVELTKTRETVEQVKTRQLIQSAIVSLLAGVLGPILSAMAIWWMIHKVLERQFGG